MRTRTADRGTLPFFERNTFPHRDVVLRVQEQLPHLYGLFHVHAMRAENEDVDRASLAKNALWRIIRERFRLHEHWRAASAVALVILHSSSLMTAAVEFRHVDTPAISTPHERCDQ